MSTQSTAQIEVDLRLLEKLRTKTTVTFNHTKSRRVMMHNCILRECDDGFMVASNDNGEVRFWVSDVEKTFGSQIFLSFVS